MCLARAVLDPATDLSCIVLFGACIEGVVLRDKYVGFTHSFWKPLGQPALVF